MIPSESIDDIISDHFQPENEGAMEKIMEEIMICFNMLPTHNLICTQETVEWINNQDTNFMSELEMLLAEEGYTLEIIDYTT